MKKIFGIFDKRPRYLAHLFLIVLTLFLGYYVGNALLNFSSGMILFKMFVWFFLVLYLADSVWEAVLKV
jgi:hypothetical protein